MKIFEEVSVCPHCGSLTEEKFAGDEGWTFCTDGCGCLEGDRPIHKFLCSECEEICDTENCNCKPLTETKMRAYEVQSHAVSKCLIAVIKQDESLGVESPETIAALTDAITTLNSAALTKEKLSITEDLIKVAQEFVIDAPSMDLTELVCYQNEFRKILDKLKL